MPTFENENNRNRVGSALMLAVLSAGCTFGGGGVPSSDDGGTGTSSDSGTGATAADETGGADGTDGADTGDPECDAELPDGGFQVAEAAGILVPDGVTPALGYNPATLDLRIWAEGALCEDLNPFPPPDPGQPPTAPLLDVQIYRPQTSAGTTPGAWPTGRFPVLVFHHGIGQSADQYDHIFRPLVEDGFIVANIDVADNEADFEAETASSAMACTVRYVTQAWAESTRIGCGVTLMGHSRGGESAALAIGPIVSEGLLELDAVIAIAGRHNIGIISPNFTRPFLALGSAVDEDVTGDGVRAYDSFGIEQPLAGAEKVLIRAYDTPHNAFGGTPTVQTSNEQAARSGLSGADYLDKGHAIASAYTRAFLRYHVLGRDEDDYRDFFSFRRFPPEVVEPTWWDYLDGYDQLPRGLDCASLVEDDCRATQGCVFASPDCEDIVCGILNNAQCDTTKGCAWDGADCSNQPVIVGSWIDPGLPSEDRAIVDAFEDGQQFVATSLAGSSSFDEWELDGVVTLTEGACSPAEGQPMACETQDTRTFFGSGHQGTALRLRSDGGSDEFVRWSLEGLANHPVGPLVASDYTHVRMRVGLRSALIGRALNSPENCVVAETDPWSVTLRLTTSDGTTRAINTRSLIQQDAIWSEVNTAIGQNFFTCAANFAMQTIEVSLAEFGAAPGEGTFSTDALTELEIQLPASNGPGEVIVDTIELVRDPNFEEGAYGLGSGVFACESTSLLAVTRTTCAAKRRVPHRRDRIHLARPARSSGRVGRTLRWVCGPRLGRRSAIANRGRARGGHPTMRRGVRAILLR